MSPAEAAIVAGRLLEFLGAGVLAGGALFSLYGPPPAGRWPWRLAGLAAASGAAGTLGWLMAQAAQLGDTPGAAFDPAAVWNVASDTGFGRAATARLGLLLAALALALPPWGGKGQWAVLAALGAAASASLAWSGHGVRDDGLAGAVHVTADVVHLVAASVWVGALAALSILLLRARRGADPDPAAASVLGLVRFSTIGVWVVTALVLSGLVNSWYLVGLAGLGRLPATPYGQLLLAKLALFGGMLVLAAANRYRHTPALQASVGGARLRPAMVSVLTETLLAAGVLVLVAWLGTLAPPVDG